MLPRRLRTLAPLPVALALAAVAACPEAAHAARPAPQVVAPVAARAAAAAAQPDPADGSPVPGAASHLWTLPLADGVVVRVFLPPAVRWGAGHRGVDLATAPGSPVLAPADGTVSFAGHVVDRGVLTVTHGGGLRSSVEPVAAPVAVGTVVRRGDVLATVAEAPGHCRPRTCLHWGVRRGDDYVDPLGLLGATTVVLLPVPADR